jgi:hypothetical protein
MVHTPSNSRIIARWSSITFFLIHPVQGESKKTDTFDIQMNNKGVSFFWLTLYNAQNDIFLANITRTQ